MEGVQQPLGALLVGSVPLESAPNVFVTAARKLHGRLDQIPDGETGNRKNFIACQHPTLPSAIKQQRAGGPVPDEQNQNYDFSLADFKSTKYDDSAIQSFAEFKELQSVGTIPHDVRFQVSLPSPAGVVRLFVVTAHCAKAESFYQERLLQALRRIQDSIPAHQLLIQWDIPIEIAMLEYDAGRLKEPHFEPYFSPVKAGILERIAGLVAAVDAGVELGFHLCYGDIRHVHFIQPQDVRIMVDLANDIVQKLAPTRTVKYIHMPVPKDRVDREYFAPLAGLELGATKLFLGLVHPGDEEGTRRRIAAAQEVWTRGFGVATECGLGRVTVEEMDSVFEIMASVSSPTK